MSNLEGGMWMLLATLCLLIAGCSIYLLVRMIKEMVKTKKKVQK